MAKHNISVTNFRPHVSGTLVGFIDVCVVEIGLKLNGVTLHAKGSARWVGLPGKPVVTDGKAQTDERGRTKYAAVVEIGSARVREAFAAAVWSAVLGQHPELRAKEAVS